MPLIEIDQLSKHYQVYQKQEGLWASVRGLFHRQYRQITALDAISLQVERGEFVAFLGPNGAGKTTTLKILSGVIHPTSGTCRVMGHVPWQRANAYRRRFALVMGQKNQLWWDLPAQESFRLHQHIYQIPAEQFQATRDELVDLLGLAKLMRQPVRELSLGERMKMELTAALLHRPEILFLDEPTIGLDVVAQHNIQQFLKHYQEVRSITILLTSHYMKDIEALCQRVVIINEGRIQFDGSLAEIVGKFDQERIVSLRLADTTGIADLQQFGRVTRSQPPQVQLRIPRSQVTSALTEILNRYQVDDVSVSDPPLEEVFAHLFTQGREATDQGASAPKEDMAGSRRLTGEARH
ncbi:MAG: ABC transporter ATP-binding protein [Pirellulaceae bacterium]|nr:ABC transporter ATP-binding protein [Pirellulaceae bacterium]